MNEEAGRLTEGEIVEDRWEVQYLLGVGELAEVYDVADKKTGAGAVLKLFAPQYLDAPGAWSAYQRHAESVRALGLPALVNPYAFGVHLRSLSPFAVADRVPVPALDQLVATVGTLLPAQFARILRELAPLLESAHAAGIVHRNLKPSNLFCGIQDPKSLRIGDFAVSALRRELSPYPGWGATPGWVAPEGIDPKAPDHPALDVYGVGLLAFFALTDRSPFLSLANFEPESFRAELMAPLPRMSERAREIGAKLDPKFDEWFARALAVNPSERFRSVTTMTEVLLDLTLQAQTGRTASWSPGGTLVMGDDARAQPSVSSAPEGGAPAPTSANAPASIGAPAFASDPGVASASVQPLVFNAELPRSPRQPAQTNNTTLPLAPASSARQPTAPARGSSSNSRPVLLAATGTAIIAVVSAIIVAAVLISEGGERANSPTPEQTSVNQTSAKGTPPPAPPTPSPVAENTSAPAPMVPASTSAEPAPTTGKVKFVCTPVACSSIHCDGKEFTELDAPIQLGAGQHRCIGSAEGYLPLITTFELEVGQELSHPMELKKKTESGERATERSAPKPVRKPKTARKAPCGTFINPCK